MKIKKGDNVKILIGKDRGKTGKVVKIDSKNRHVTVEGLNLYKKHTRPKRQNEKGEIIQVVRPINSSNVMIVCPSCHKPSRVGHRLDGAKKVRYCKKCKASI